MRRNAVLPRPYRFFAALWKLLMPRGMMQVLLAEQQTMGRRRIIAGSLFLMFGKTVSYAFNGSSVRDNSSRPNDAIFWQAINDACKGGFESFDFGEVTEDHPDLAKYKSKWGAEPVRLYRYYYPHLSNEHYTPTRIEKHVEILARAMWRCLPLKATSWLGDRIYARL
jgi:lipid II:glycine glycyltransferase (peptidoglycan interpeptide bridge formation enzyme)